MILKIVAVFIMGTAVGIMYRIPRRLLGYCSAIGVLAYLTQITAIMLGANNIFATFLASLAVGCLAEFFARLLKKPATMFSIPGFIPLVPGRMAYTAMLYMVEGKHTAGVAAAMETMLTGGSIAFGIFMSTNIYRLLANYRMRVKVENAEKS